MLLPNWCQWLSNRGGCFLQLSTAFSFLYELLNLAATLMCSFSCSTIMWTNNRGACDCIPYRCIEYKRSRNCGILHNVVWCLWVFLGGNCWWCWLWNARLPRCYYEDLVCQRMQWLPSLSELCGIRKIIMCVCLLLSWAQRTASISMSQLLCSNKVVHRVHYDPLDEWFGSASEVGSPDFLPMGPPTLVQNQVGPKAHLVSSIHPTMTGARGTYVG